MARLTRLSILLAALLFSMVPLFAPVYAQLDFEFHTGATATADGNEMDVLDSGTISVQTEGTFVGTVTVKAKATPASGWSTILCTNTASDARTSTLTAPGILQCNTSGLYRLKAEVTAFTSGPIKVKGRRGTQSSSRGGGGGSGTVTSVSASGGVETVSGSAITATGTIRGARCIKHETGTTYTFLAADRGCVVTFSNADPISATLPEAGTTGFEEKWFVIPLNLGAGTVTITPDTSTIQGGLDVDLTTGKSLEIVSDDTNYFYSPGLGITAEAQGLGDVIAINRIFGGAVSQATAPHFGSDATGRYWAPWDDPTTGLVFTCIVATVPHACDKGQLIADTFKFYVSNAAGARLFDFSPNASTSKEQYALGTLKIRKYIFIPAGYFVGDGTNCPLVGSAVTINSGPKTITMICGSGANGDMDFDFVMDPAWDGGTLEFEPSYTQTAANTSAMNSDIKTQCRGAGETPSSTWGTAIAIDDAAVTGSSAEDKTLSAAVTPAGTCTGGDHLYGRYTLDVTGTTTPEATLHFYGIGMYYYVTSLGS